MSAPVQLSFDKGELDPEIIFRNDLNAITSGLAKCSNAFVKWQGGIVRRGGLEFLAKTINPLLPSRFIPFSFSRTDNYMLEFCEDKMRIFRNGGLVLYPTGHLLAGQIVVITTPLNQSLLFDLHFCQTGNVLTLTHSDIIQREIRRIDHHDWQIGLFETTEPPWDLANVDKTKLISVSAQTGTVNLTSSFAFFNAAQIGSKLKIAETPQQIAGVSAWEASKHLCGPSSSPLNILTRANGKVYKCTTSATMPASPNANCFTGTIKPDHNEGTRADGSKQVIAGQAHQAGVDWEYQHSGYGVVQITSVTDAFNAVGVVTSLIPNTIAGVSTYNFAFEAWNETNGYPKTVSYFGDRVYFGGSKLRSEDVWGSEVGLYKSFKISSPQLDRDSVSFRLAGSQRNEIQHVLPLTDLVIITTSAEWLAKGGQNRVITPATSSDVKIQSYNGANNLQPIIVGLEAIYQQYMQSDIRSFGFSLNNDNNDGYGGKSLNVLSRHLFADYSIVSWCFAREPNSILWAVREDGVLLSQTTYFEQDVIGWAQHHTDGQFASIASVENGKNNDVYVCVKRGAEHFVEILANNNNKSDEWIFADSALTLNNWQKQAITIGGAGYLPSDVVTLYSFGGAFVGGDVGKRIHVRKGNNTARLIVLTVASATTITARPIAAIPDNMRGVSSPEYGFAVTNVSGLSHLAGREVCVLADGEAQNNKTVVSGSITLDNPAVRICVGLPYETHIVTLPLDNYTPSNPVSIKAVKKNIKRVHIGAIGTRGIKVGQADNLLEEIVISNIDNISTTPPAMANTSKHNISGVWNLAAQVIIKQNYPLPMHITMIGMEVDIAQQ